MRSRESSLPVAAGVTNASSAMRWLRLAVAALAGVALAHAFAPYEWWLLAPVAIGTLYALIERRAAGEARRLGYAFGLGYYGFGVYWIYHSLHLFGAAIAPLAATITALFVFGMALFPLAVVAAWAWLRPGVGRVSSGLIFTALWSLSELSRGLIFGGFPWILVGYSQTTGPLGAFAPVVGVYGIGTLVVGLTVSLIVALTPWRDRASAGRGAGRVLRSGAARRGGLIAVAASTSVMLAAYAVGTIEWTRPLDRVLAVRLVQANIPQEMKFSRERLQDSLERYTAMSLAAPIGTELVIWPETAIPTHMDRIEPALGPFVRRMEDRGIEVLSGVFVRDGERVYNSVRQLGGARQVYRKRHLVPFGEFMPFRPVLDHVARFVDIPMSDLAADTGPHRPLHVAGERLGVSICYEDVYGEELRPLLPASTVLVNVSNDAWFGDSAAPHQHEQKARMRARELGRPMIRVTNTGVSSAIEHDGGVLGRIQHDRRGALDVNVVPREGTTPYVRFGNAPVWAFALALPLAAVALRRRTAAKRA